jgi:tetratricopeptide (TPR) repeat protein
MIMRRHATITLPSPAPIHSSCSAGPAAAKPWSATDEPADRRPERSPVTGESIDALAQELDRVLGARPQDPAAVAVVLERAVAACRSDPAAADRWHEPELWDELVDVYEQLGRTDDAIAAMRSAIAAGWRGRPDGRCRIAELLMRAGRLAEATPLWDQVRADTPDDVWLYNNAGPEYADVGDDATALTWLTDGLELALATGDPEQLVDQLHDLRGAALSRLGRPADRLQDRAKAFLDVPVRTGHRFAAPPSTALLSDGRAAPSPFRRPRSTDQECPA